MESSMAKAVLKVEQNSNKPTFAAKVSKAAGNYGETAEIADENRLMHRLRHLKSDTIWRSHRGTALMGSSTAE